MQPKEFLEFREEGVSLHAESLALKYKSLKPRQWRVAVFQPGQFLPPWCQRMCVGSLVNRRRSKKDL
eukprot:3382900-Rhodomonas_salina.1